MQLMVRQLGRVEYSPCWQAMKNFTESRDSKTLDECWLVEHPPVYTLGQAGKKEHILNPKGIEVVQSDRGGQVTYHGPGQWVFYLMADLKRLNIGVRQFVSNLENSVINLLAEFEIESEALSDAPGVYVNGAKVAALGLRIKKRCSYHGLSINVDMDLTPFSGINPCGYAGMAVTSTTQLDKRLGMFEVKSRIIEQIMKQFGYTTMLSSKKRPECWR